MRRGLVLDLSIAGGKAPHPPSAITKQLLIEAKSPQVLEQHLAIYGGMVSDSGRMGPSGGGLLTFTGFHLPRVRARDQFYANLEDQRAREAGFK